MKNYRKQKVVYYSLCVILILAVMVVCVVCQPKTMFRFFATQATAVDAAMKTAGDFYRAGKISETDKDQIVTAYNAYKKTYDRAIDEYAAYMKLPEEQKDSAIEKVQLVVEAMNRNLDVLILILERLGIEIES